MIELHKLSPYGVWRFIEGWLSDVADLLEQFLPKKLSLVAPILDNEGKFLTLSTPINFSSVSLADGADSMKRIYRDGSYETLGSLRDIFNFLPHPHRRRNLQDEYPLEIVQEWLHYIDKVLETQQTQFYEYEETSLDKSFYKEVQLIPFSPQEVVGIVRDITERKRMEKALEKSEEQYRQIVETATEGVWIINSEDRTTFVNSRMAEMLGYSVREILNHSLLDFTDEEGRILAKNYMERRHKGIEESCDFKFICKNGSELWVMISTSPTFDGKGEYVGTLSMVTDITKRKLAELALRKSELTNRALINTIPDAMFLVNKSGVFLDIKVSQGCPFSSGELLGKHLGDVFPVDVTESAMKYVKLALLTRSVESFEYYLEDQFIFFPETGTEHHFEARMIAINEDEVLTIVRDITERKKVEETIRYQANYDLLTGLPNRMKFNDHLAHLLHEAEVKNHQLAVCFLDIDHFKRINDTLGHGVGDLLLKSFAMRVKNSVRQGDFVARWAGDEFTIIIPQIDTTTQVAQIAQRILDHLKPIFDLEGHQLHISSSVGIALYPQDGISAETLIKNADSALYYAKEQGRNNYQFYNKTLSAKTGDLLNLQNRLHQAFEQGEFEVFYQPKVSINSWDITGMEALVRWKHPTLGILSPTTFIPIAEENGLIFPLGESVLKTACHQMKLWHDQGWSNLRVSVNLSPRQFQNPSLVNQVAHCLEETGLSPEYLELEVTESTCMKNQELTQKVLNELHLMGVKIVLDDFGTGYYSLSCLRNFPIDILKLDKSFIEDMRMDSYDQILIKTVISLSHCLNMEVVAEGVETQEQLEFLRGVDCEELQGYLFSRPLSAKKMTRLLRGGQSNIIDLFGSDLAVS